jgi:hypothetical protein
MADLQLKLGNTQKLPRKEMHASQPLNRSGISESGFRQNILQRLGNAHSDDSQASPDLRSGDFRKQEFVDEDSEF